MARLLRLAATARGPAVAVVAATGVAAAATITAAVIVARLIAEAFDAGDSTGAAGLRLPLGFLSLLLGVIAVRAIAVGAGEAAAQRISTGIRSRLRRAAMASLLAQGRDLSRERTGELVTTVIDGIDKLDAFYRRFVPQALATAIVPALILVAVAFLDPLSGMLLAVTGPLIPLFMWLLGSMAASRARDQWLALSLLGGRFLDTLQGLPTLTAFNRAPEAALALEDASEQLRVRTMGVLRVAFLSGLVLELAASISTAIVAVSVGVRLVEGWMSFGTGLTVLLLTPEFYLPFRQLGQRHHAGMEGTAAAEQIFRIIDAEQTPAMDVWPALDGKSGAASMDHVHATQPRTLSVHALTVTYPDASAPALHDITVTFAPRTLTAIVGDSGAGKSTLLAALLRLVEPASGEIRLGDRPARATSAVSWRSHFAFVPQRPRFLHGTLLDNLRMGRADATLADIVGAARLAHADRFIDSLPEGYATVIDETASTLSGGERQRLAIARALVRRAPVLLLDEPTSSLDDQTASLIADTLRRVRHERTVIVVTHRLGLAAMADHVVTLDNGRITADAFREVA
jgi:ATP-binding cassette subfamily C protein CydD